METIEALPEPVKNLLILFQQTLIAGKQFVNLVEGKEMKPKEAVQEIGYLLDGSAEIAGAFTLELHGGTIEEAERDLCGAETAPDDLPPLSALPVLSSPANRRLLESLRSVQKDAFAVAAERRAVGLDATSHGTIAATVGILIASIESEVSGAGKGTGE